MNPPKHKISISNKDNPELFTEIIKKLKEFTNNDKIKNC